MIDKIKYIILLTVLVNFSQPALAQALPDSIPLRVIIIRHGEKPPKGLNLSCKGYNRSVALPKVLTSLFGIPDFVYVPTMRSGKSINAVRMYQTVVPLVVKYGINVNTLFQETDTITIVKDIVQKKGTILVVWDLKNILPLVRNFGILKELKWHPDDFDAIWIINFIRDKEGVLHPSLVITKENIHPSSYCK